MGHDIFGYKTTDQKNEIAYLRRGAFNPLNNEIYKSLECESYNGGSSGISESKEFTKDNLLKALKYLGDNDDLSPERVFLNDCIENIDEDNKIIIYFG